MLPALKIGGRRFEPQRGLQVSKLPNVFSQLTRNDRDVACSASEPQDSNFKSCVWRAVSFYSSHHPQEVLLAQVSLYVHKGGFRNGRLETVYPLLSLGPNNSQIRHMPPNYMYVCWVNPHSFYELE